MSERSSNTPVAESHFEVSGMASKLKPAPLRRRYAAAAIDLLIMIALVQAGIGILRLAGWTWDNSLEFRFVIPYAANILFIPVIYLTIAHVRGGASPGKRLFGLRVTSVADQSSPSWKQALSRSAAYLYIDWMYALGPLLIHFRPDRRRVGDHIAGTMVVEAQQ